MTQEEQSRFRCGLCRHGVNKIGEGWRLLDVIGLICPECYGENPQLHNPEVRPCYACGALPPSNRRSSVVDSTMDDGPEQEDDDAGDPEFDA